MMPKITNKINLIEEKGAEVTVIKQLNLWICG